MKRVSYAFALAVCCGVILSACSGLTRSSVPVPSSREPAVNACPVDTGCPTSGGYHTPAPINYTVPYLSVCPNSSTATCGGPAPTPSSSPGALAYGGGEIIGSKDGTPTQVYLDYWGWQGDSAGEQAFLNAFLASVGSSPWLNTLTQYQCCGGTNQFGDTIANTRIVNNASMLQGTFSDSSTAPTLTSVGTTATSSFENAVKSEALSVEQHFGGNYSAVYVIALPTQHWSFVNTQECAYHNYAVDANGHDVAFALLPYIPDAGTLCGANSVNGSAGALDGVSIVMGHELAEALTDPVPFSGFSTQNQEVGDLCSWIGLGDSTLSGRSFAMQPLWSNAAASGSDPYGMCVMSYP